MKTFTQFVAENVVSLTVHQFPLLLKALVGRKKAMTTLTAFIDTFNAAVAADHIEKKQVTLLQNEYIAITTAVGEYLSKKYPENIELPVPENAPVHGTVNVLHPSGMKHGYEMENEYRWMRQSIIRGQFPSHYDSMMQHAIKENPYAVLGPDWAKTSKLFSDLQHEYTEFMTEYNVLRNAFKQAETLIPTKAKLKAKAEFELPEATKQAKGIIRTTLKKMTDEIIVKFEHELAGKWINAIDKFFNLGHEERRVHLGLDLASNKAREERNAAAKAKHGVWAQLEKRQPHYLESLLAMISATQKSNEGVVFEPHYDWQAKLQKLAAEQAKMMQEQFIDKNVMKLSSIVERKGNLQGEPTILSISTSDGSVTGELRFNFKDKSTFIVRNKVVSQYRYDGKNVTSFYQFPTTFHNAVLPNGKRMEGMPSEQQMNEIFATA